MPVNVPAAPNRMTRAPRRSPRTVLVHLSSGIGNIVLARPLLLALHRHGFIVDILVDGDYADTADLFRGWDAVRAVYNGRARQRPGSRYHVRVAAIPPFYWSRYASDYGDGTVSVPRPTDALFYRNERAYYLEFARALGCDIDGLAECSLPVAPDTAHAIGAGTLALAPGCKTNEMAAKRWPYFPRLAEAFADVVVVGTADDLRRFDGSPMQFPAHARSLVGELSLRETAAVLAAAGAVVANDSGLGHLAAAVGAPTVLLFGPTPHTTLGRFPAQRHGSARGPALRAVLVFGALVGMRRPRRLPVAIERRDGGAGDPEPGARRSRTIPSHIHVDVRVDRLAIVIVAFRQDLRTGGDRHACNQRIAGRQRAPHPAVQAEPIGRTLLQEKPFLRHEAVGARAVDEQHAGRPGKRHLHLLAYGLDHEVFELFVLRLRHDVVAPIGGAGFEPQRIEHRLDASRRLGKIDRIDPFGRPGRPGKQQVDEAERVRTPRPYRVSGATA